MDCQEAAKAGQEAKELKAEEANAKEAIKGEEIDDSGLKKQKSADATPAAAPAESAAPKSEAPAPAAAPAPAPAPAAKSKLQRSKRHAKSGKSMSLRKKKLAYAQKKFQKIFKKLFED